jgi:hypothetical protein
VQCLGPLVFRGMAAAIGTNRALLVLLHSLAMETRDCAGEDFLAFVQGVERPMRVWAIHKCRIANMG